VASLQYLFFAGKGGTGKTTCAAAAAIASAERGKRLLVISTDPAHSLGDVLGRKLTTRPAPVPVRRGSLRACELDADRALTRWLGARRSALADILERGTWLDRSDVESFLELSLPGVDELFGLIEVERLGEGGVYDEVIVDSAPTGHMLRLLAMPATWTSLAGVLGSMHEKYRVVATAVGRRSHHDTSDALIDELRGDAERLAALVRNRSRTRVCWVTLPEILSVAESARAIATLRRDGIRVTDVVINRLTPPPPSRCAFCEARREAEAESLSTLPSSIRTRATAIWTIPAVDEPPRGIAALRTFARMTRPFERQVTRRRRRPVSASVRTNNKRIMPAVLVEPVSTRLLIVGGKGGVGKTTCAAAVALAAARSRKNRRVLLISTDPAHSIGDALGQNVGDVERRVRGAPDNLRAREIDAAKGWRERCDHYRASVGRMFEALTGGSHVELTIDRDIIEQLLELAPPGMDEVTGMLTMIDTLFPDGEAAPTREAPTRETKGAPTFVRQDLVIVDTAPTGHALRLLAVPGQARRWVRQLMSVLLKYRIVGITELAEELLSLSRDLGRLQQLLTDARACGFVVVTRPERLPVVETTRLIDWLRRHHIERRALIVNGLTPGECRRCRRAAERERREIATLIGDDAWKRSRSAIIEADAVAPPPRGVAALEAWGRTWRSAMP
jgi:arsenite-transporting ATPase